MGVRTKGRRKIMVNGKRYIWYVALDYDSPYNVLHISNEGKSLIISCPLKTSTQYIICKGSVFQKKKTGGCWNRYLLPFPVPNAITPKFVSHVILWASEGEGAVDVCWDGRDVPV